MVYGPLIFQQGCQDHSMGERKVFSTKIPRQLDSYMQKKSLMPYIKINSKLIKGLNVKTKTIKLFEENIGVKLHDFGFGKGFLDMTPKT